MVLIITIEMDLSCAHKHVRVRFEAHWTSRSLCKFGASITNEKHKSKINEEIKQSRERNKAPTYKA